MWCNTLIRPWGPFFKMIYIPSYADANASRAVWAPAAINIYTRELSLVSHTHHPPLWHAESFFFVWFIYSVPSFLRKNKKKEEEEWGGGTCKRKLEFPLRGCIYLYFIIIIYIRECGTVRMRELLHGATFSCQNICRVGPNRPPPQWRGVVINLHRS